MRTEYGKGPRQLTVREFTQPDERQVWYSTWLAWIEGEQPGGIVEDASIPEALLALVGARWRDLGLSAFDRLRIALDALVHGPVDAGKRLWKQADAHGWTIVVIELPPDDEILDRR